jgi:hypothetical protein
VRKHKPHHFYKFVNKNLNWKNLIESYFKFVTKITIVKTELNRFFKFVTIITIVKTESNRYLISSQGLAGGSAQQTVVGVSLSVRTPART